MSTNGHARCNPLALAEKRCQGDIKESNYGSENDSLLLP